MASQVAHLGWKRALFALFAAVCCGLGSAEAATPPRALFSPASSSAAATEETSTDAGDHDEKASLFPLRQQSTVEALEYADGGVRSPRPQRNEEELKGRRTAQRTVRNNASRVNSSVRLLAVAAVAAVTIAICFSYVLRLKCRARLPHSILPDLLPKLLEPLGPSKPTEVLVQPMTEPPGRGERTTHILKSLKGLKVSFIGQPEGETEDTAFEAEPTERVAAVSSGDVYLTMADVATPILMAAKENNALLLNPKFAQECRSVHTLLSEGASAYEGELVGMDHKGKSSVFLHSYAFRSKGDGTGWNTRETGMHAGTSFLHILKPEFRPGSQMNSVVIYTVPPNNDTSIDDFEKAYTATMESLFAVISEFNETPMGEEHRVDAVRLPHLGQYFLYMRPSLEDVLRCTVRGLQQAVEKYGTGVSVQFSPTSNPELFYMLKDEEDEYLRKQKDN